VKRSLPGPERSSTEIVTPLSLLLSLPLSLDRFARFRRRFVRRDDEAGTDPPVALRSLSPLRAIAHRTTATMRRKRNAAISFVRQLILMK
jgi:hypothetical protein